MEDKEILTVVSSKLSTKVFWTVMTIIIGVMGIAIGNLYTLYFSGITSLKEDMATVKTKVEYIQSDVEDIKKQLRISILEYE